MTNYREILRLHSLGHTQRSIAASAKASRNTVSDVLKRAQELRITWPLDDDVTNEALDELLYGRRESSSTPYAVINYEYIHQQLVYTAPKTAAARSQTMYAKIKLSQSGQK